MDIYQFFLRNITRLINIIYPPTCLSCGEPGQNKLECCLDLCAQCEQSLPWLKQACKRCALPLPDDAGETVSCGRCLKKAPYFDESLSLFSFEKASVGLIHQLKFHDKLAVSRLLGQLLTDAVIRKKHDLPDCLLPVPLYKKRLKQRGFNQSIELARSLAKTCNIPLDIDSVERCRETQSQTGLDAKQRRKNIRGVFEVVKKMNYNHVAIIDDVVTTASTVNELSRVLKRNGVNRVSIYSIARALVK